MRRTFGIGIGSVPSPPRSSSKFLMRIDRSATSRSTGISTLSEVVSMIIFLLPSAAEVEAAAIVDMWG